MLGDRYGYRPPPPEVSADEYEMLLAEAERLHHKHLEVVRTWYRKDDNAVPPMYVLQVKKFHSSKPSHKCFGRPYVSGPHTLF